MSGPPCFPEDDQPGLRMVILVSSQDDEGGLEPGASASTSPTNAVDRSSTNAVGTSSILMQ